MYLFVNSKGSNLTYEMCYDVSTWKKLFYMYIQKLQTANSLQSFYFSLFQANGAITFFLNFDDTILNIN